MDSSPPARSALWGKLLKNKKSSLKSIGLFAAGILCAFVAIILYNLAFPGAHQLTSREVNDTVQNILASATPRPSYSSGVYRVIQPSLVLIQTKGTDSNNKSEFALGSGVVIDDAGDILTSLHVVADATEINLTFADGSEMTAHIVNQQPENDIAVLRADGTPKLLVPAVLGNPNAMRVGDEAFVVGNPFGLYSSMSAGVISGFNRSFRPQEKTQELQGLIQIDTAVNPGNSGGPLLNRSGQVIGIVTGIINPTGQDVFIGIGFAVPITTAGGAAGSPPY
jgi:S1-C subfamily serine protease